MTQDCPRCRQLEAQVNELAATVRRQENYIQRLRNLIAAIGGQLNALLRTLANELDRKPTMSRLDLLKHVRGRTEDLIEQIKEG